jgi:hypothetical protein
MTNTLSKELLSIVGLFVEIDEITCVTIKVKEKTIYIAVTTHTMRYFDSYQYEIANYLLFIS